MEVLLPARAGKLSSESLSNNVLLRDEGGWGQTLSISVLGAAAKGTYDPCIPMKLAALG